MPEIKEVVYSSKIIKAGALIADTKTLLTHWDLSISVTENLERCTVTNYLSSVTD